MRDIIAGAAASFVLLCSASANADPVQDALEDYALYQHDVSTLLDVKVDSARTVDAARTRLARHNSARVSRGWIAYGALTAAHSQRFADGIERRVRGDGRAAVIGQLREDITYARRQQASAQATQLIFTAASADSARAAQAGARYDRYARNATAGMRLASSGGGELPGVTRLSDQMLDRLRGGGRGGVRSASGFGDDSFWDSVSGRTARSPQGRAGRERPEYASVTDHMLTLAALIAADATQSERRRVSDLLNEPLTQQCMEMQRLQLRQCLSVTVDASERAYCLNQHALAGPGSCFSNITR